MRKCINLLVLFFCVVQGNSQDTVLSMEEYIDQVMKHHPIMYQADLLREAAIAQKRMARGGFDPKLEAEWDQKRFKDTNYYSLGGGKLKVPTWFGVELEAGYKQSSGDFLDASDFLPSRGLWNAGISVPLGKGFMIDERRADLKSADIMINMTEQERIIKRNEVLFDAMMTYVSWQQAEAYLGIAEEGVLLAKDRLDAMRSSFEEGDKPAVDTLEAQISLRVREAELLKAEQALENVRINIENYLWVEGFVPLEMDGNVRAEELIDDRFQVGINSIQLQSEQLIAKHPELLMYGFKVEGLGVDRRLAREELKPDLRLDYNPLVGLGTNSLVGTFNPADYMLGVSFNYPIVQRKQRGKLDLIDVKLKDTEIDLALKNQLIRTKLRNFENNINQSIAQRVIFESMVFDYSRLLSAERRKFDIGESSIFLINSREIKYLESRYKSVEASTKVLSNQLKYMFVLGVMDEIVSVIN